jgi:hypothetical protein
MNFRRLVVLLALLGCDGAAGADSSGSAGPGNGNGIGNGGRPGSTPSGTHISLPKVYPPVRASTPSSLIADPTYQSVGQAASALTGDQDAGMMMGMPAPGGGINLAEAVQERLYTAGPTEILRIVKGLDDTVAGLNTDPAQHPCLGAAPVDTTLALPGVMFHLKLQCIQQGNGNWLAFGFDNAYDADAGPVAADSSNDFYLVRGQDGGMGGAYHIDGATGDVDAWLSVADSRAPQNSQVIMHLMTNKAAATLELALAGSGVGFCSAHLKTGNEFLFIEAKTNGAAPPGTPLPPSGQYCDAQRIGCFGVAALHKDLGGAADGCRPIAASSFAISHALDASSDPGANVIPALIYKYFDAAPSGIPAF